MEAPRADSHRRPHKRTPSEPDGLYKRPMSPFWHFTAPRIGFRGYDEISTGKLDRKEARAFREDYLSRQWESRLPTDIREPTRTGVAHRNVVFGADVKLQDAAFKAFQQRPLPGVMISLFSFQNPGNAAIWVYELRRDESAVELWCRNGKKSRHGNMEVAALVDALGRLRKPRAITIFTCSNELRSAIRGAIRAARNGTPTSGDQRLANRLLKHRVHVCMLSQEKREGLKKIAESTQRKAHNRFSLKAPVRVDESGQLVERKEPTSARSKYIDQVVERVHATTSPTVQAGGLRYLAQVPRTDEQVVVTGSPEQPEERHCSGTTVAGGPPDKAWQQPHQDHRPIHISRVSRR